MILAAGGLHAAFIYQPVFWDIADGVAPAVAAADAVAPAEAVAVAIAVTVAVAVLLSATVDEELVESGNNQHAVGFVEGLDWNDCDHLVRHSSGHLPPLLQPPPLQQP